MGRPRRRGRDVHGILLLDKPSGASSNDVLQKVKRLYNANKAGHTGALDPLATGMLPICLGEATKFSHFLLDADKRYRVVARLGERTNTSDADGEIVARRAVDFTPAQLDAALAQFRGESDQIPSMYSALKYQGRPLYEYARAGISVPRESRKIHVYELTLLYWQNNELALEVHCSKGTYIRTIVDDLGEQLGCGAHVIDLRRLNVARYPADKMVTLAQLQQIAADAQTQEMSALPQLDALLLPMDSAVADLPEVNLLPVMGVYVKQGQAVQAAGAPRSGLVRMTVGDEREFIGVGQIDDDGRVAPKRLVVERFE